MFYQTPNPPPTQAELDAAREWIADCDWAERQSDPGWADELTDGEIIAGIACHYDGGWTQFRRDSYCAGLVERPVVKAVRVPRDFGPSDVTGEPDSTSLRELDAREGDGIQVWLLWDPEADRTFVEVLDARKGCSYRFLVQPGEAREAFLHPFAYSTGIQKNYLAAH